MPNATVRRLQRLFDSGLDVYPVGMRGLAAKPARAGMPVERGNRRGALPVKPQAARQFVAWVKANAPDLYSEALRRQSVRTLGAVTTGSTAVSTGDGPLDKLLTTIQTLAPQYLQYKAQQDVLDVQLDRMRAGLPPLRATDYAPAVQIGVDPNIITNAGAQLRPLLIYGGLAVLGVFLLSKAMGGRRR